MYGTLYSLASYTLHACYIVQNSTQSVQIRIIQYNILDGLITITEILEESFHAYLQQYGYTFVDDQKKLDENFEEINKNADVKFAEAQIDFQTRKQVDIKLENIGNPKIYTNRETKDHYEQFEEKVTYSVGSENVKTNWSGWSVTGAATATYQGAGASGGVGYERVTSEEQKVCEAKEHTETFNETVHVPGETRRKVAVEKQCVQVTCKVSDLLVTFKKSKSQIKCKVEFGHRKQKKNETFKLKNIFKDTVVSDTKNDVTIRMCGKYIWTETSVYLRRYDPEPMRGLDRV